MTAHSDPLVNRLIDVLDLPPEDLVDHVYQIIRDCADSPSKTQKTTLARLIMAYVDELPLDFLGFSASLVLGVGSLVEYGADPDAIAPVFVAVLARAIASIANGLDDTRTEEEEEAEAFILDVAQRFELSAAAILSRSRYARQCAREQHNLLEKCVSLRWDCTFLHHITHLLDNEELLVIHTQEKWGFRTRISGISDNWQLHILLAHTLYNALDPSKRIWTPPSNAIASCLSGSGNQLLEDEMVSGVWDMHDWTAAGLSEPPSQHWVWGEGIPADIMHCPVLDERRVLLLGPPSYGRTTSASRDFEALQADIEIVEAFSPEQVADILEKLSATPLDVRQQAILDHCETINRAA